MLSYVVPLRRSKLEPIDELAAYLKDLAHRVEVIVVDGSDEPVFAAHRAALGREVRHVPVSVRAGRSGKVNGVLTGLSLAGRDRVVLADDDVRWTPEQLVRVADLLDHADAVRPQNYFSPLPWHARWDTARSLLNRSVGADYPGTLAVRRQLLLAAGGYDADVLFENLELLRTVEAAGGAVANAADLYVRRVPPSVRHFLGQRVRQAYDSFAQPPRLAAELTVVPVVARLLHRRRAGVLAVLVGAVLAAAERGRRRAGGSAVFPPSATAMAPLWLAERAVCSWLAVLCRVRGGVPYAGERFPRAANSAGAIRRRLRSPGSMSGQS